MKSINNVRIGPKLLLAFALMLGFAGVTGFVAVSRMSQVSAEMDRIASNVLGSVYGVATIGSNAGAEPLRGPRGADAAATALRRRFHAIGPGADRH